MKIDSLHSPQIVATVTQLPDLDFLSSTPSLAFDVLEYRIDNLINDVEKVASVLDDSRLPSLITVRCPNEGGANDLSDDKRIQCYRKFLNRADMIDVEIASFQSGSEFLALAKEAQEREVVVIASFHDFSGFPGRDKLVSVIEAGYETGADVVKLAVVVETMPQLFQLVELVEEQKNKGRLISAMGMGALGKLSRLVLARSGSCLNYGFLQTENAPGQWSAEELKSLVEAIA